MAEMKNSSAGTREIPRLNGGFIYETEVPCPFCGIEGLRTAGGYTPTISLMPEDLRPLCEATHGFITDTEQARYGIEIPAPSFEQVASYELWKIENPMTAGKALQILDSYRENRDLLHEAIHFLADHFDMSDAAIARRSGLSRSGVRKILGKS